MADTAGFELAEDLVLRARAAGFDLSTDQIARWNRDGLLPKPHQRGLGRGKGSEICYPVRTGDQLLALCVFRKQYRKLEAVGWYLWLNNFTVTERYWRTPLISAATYFDANRHVFKTKLLDTAYGITSVRMSAGKFFESLAELQPDNRHFRRARRRVGVGQIGEFCRIMLTIAIGAYRVDSEPNEHDRATERKIIERGLGTARARIDRLDNGQLLLSGDVEPILEQLSGRLAKVTRSASLKAIYSDQIIGARDELKLLFLGLAEAYKNFEKTRGKRAFGLGVVAEFATLTDIRLQALMILLFEMTIRRDAQNALQAVLSAVERKMKDGRQLDLSPPSQ
jgi:hypothetical protein